MAARPVDERRAADANLFAPAAHMTSAPSAEGASAGGHCCNDPRVRSKPALRCREAQTPIINAITRVRHSSR